MIRITHSSMVLAKTCLRAYQFRYVAGIVRERTDPPLRIGSLFHEGLEHGKVPEKPDYPGWCRDEEEQYKHDCDYELARAMIEAYLKYWKDDACETITCEQSFRREIRNPSSGRSSRTVEVAGKLDKIVKTPDGRLALMEHKTTSEDLDPTSYYWQRLMLDQQVSLYYMHSDVKTVLYDVTRRPALKPKQIPLVDNNGLKIVTDDETGDRVVKKNGEPRQSAGKGMTLETRPEDPDEYGLRCYMAMTDEPERYFARREIPRTEADIDEFRQELWIQAKLLYECHQREYFFRNTNSCKPYGRPCQYFDLCYSGWKVGDDLPLGFIYRIAHTELEGGKDGKEDESAADRAEAGRQV